MKAFDLIVYNARIYTMEREGEIYAAMGIRRGKIAALFENNPQNPESMAKQTLDAGGRAILPGLTDSHMHFLPTAALSEMALCVSEPKNGRLEPCDLEGVKQKLIAFAKDLPKKSLVIGFQYVIASIREDRLPTRQELDAWLPGRAVALISMDGHSSAYSTHALMRMGLMEEDHSGLLTGEAHDHNIGKINSLVGGSLTLPRLARGIQNTVNAALSYGITCLHALDGFEDLKSDSGLWFLSRIGGTLPLHLRLYAQYTDADRVRPYAKFLSRPRLGGCGAWEMDGSIGSGTAAFPESYANDEENFGKCYYTQQQIERFAGNADEAGYQVAAHAIGTAAIERLLSAYENIGATKRLRHRIEHFEFPSADQVKRAVRDMGLVITAQPGYAWMDEAYQKAYRKYLRPEQFDRQIPLRTIADMGGILCGSSDSPVQDMNPFLQIHGMVNFPLGHERLSVYQALRAYTYNGAYATFDEDTRGTLTTGKRADFVVMEQDPFAIPPENLLELQAKYTYFGGKEARRRNIGVVPFLLRGFLGRHRKI